MGKIGKPILIRKGAQMNATLATFLVLLLSIQFANAHGEGKPGPNGGFIRMPGAFHTEVVPIGRNRMKVFLLDINWKNPTVLDSSLKAVHVSMSKKKTEGVCNAEKSEFVCEFDRSVDLSKAGALEIEALRNSQKGAPVSYSLPFKLEGDNSVHGAHH